jgi:hypothetical protein
MECFHGQFCRLARGAQPADGTLSDEWDAFFVFGFVLRRYYEWNDATVSRFLFQSLLFLRLPALHFDRQLPVQTPHRPRTRRSWCRRRPQVFSDMRTHYRWSVDS